MPGPDVVEQIAALTFWKGRGTVRLIRADAGAGVMLLDTPLTTRPVDEAMALLGRMMRRLAVPAPLDVPCTAGQREPWLTVDPVLMRGDLGFDLARVLWTRLDEMPTAAAIRGHLDAVVRAAGIDSAQGRDWVLWRSVDYWLWGLGNGLSQDPLRCRRLMTVFTA